MLGRTSASSARKRSSVRDALAVGVQHDVGDAACLRRPHHRNDLRVDGRLAARELHDLRIAFGGDEAVQNVFHFFERQIEAGSRFGETERARHIARAVDLDDAEAGVLLVVGAEAAIVRAAVLDFGSESRAEWCRVC